jgi:hypothetical protein
MRILRVIYRLDYSRSYEMLNRPGSVAKIIDSEVPSGYYDVQGEDRASRRIQARRLLRDGRRYRSVSVEPTAVVLDMEVAHGIPPDALADDKDFVTQCTLISALLKEFKITRFERAGLRFFIFGSNAGGRSQSVLGALKSNVTAALAATVETTLGSMGDIGIAFSNAADAKVGYNLRAGPFIGKSEIVKYFTNINDLLTEDDLGDTVIDLDIFELKFDYGVSSAIKWCLPQITMAAQSAAKITSLIKDEVAK